jgi:hypothetical protein
VPYGLAIGGFAVSYQFGSEKTTHSQGRTGLSWPVLIVLIAVLPAALSLLLVVVLAPPASTPAAARSVRNTWSAGALVVQCQGFDPGDTAIFFLTPSMDRAFIEREPVTELPVSPQGTCDSGPMTVNADISSRNGWLLVAQGKSTGEMATSPFIAASEPKSREALAAPAQQAALDKPASSMTQPQSSLLPERQGGQPLTPTADPGRSLPDDPYNNDNRPCKLRTPQELEGIWCVEYYPDRDQHQSPVYVDFVPPKSDNLLIDWRKANWPPGAGDMPAENYRMVFFGRFYFSETRSYRFTLRVQGSARVHIDRLLVIDSFAVGNKRQDTSYLPISTGYHDIKLEYFLDGGLSSIFFRKDPDGNRNDFWLGRYYANAIREGAVAMIRQDNDINFVWNGTPDQDMGTLGNFSVQWLRAYQVPRNGMRCSMQAIGRVRVYVDGKLVPELSNWDGPNTWEQVAILNAGRRFVEVNFEKHSLPAQIRFTCNPVTPAY